MYQIFSSLLGHLLFSVHFLLHFYGVTFFGTPNTLYFIDFGVPQMGFLVFLLWGIQGGVTSFVWANETQREVATVGGGVLRGPIRHKEKWPQLEEEFCVGTAGFDLEDFIHFQFLLHLPAKNFFLWTFLILVLLFVHALSLHVSWWLFVFFLFFIFFFFSQSILPSLSPSIYGSFVGSIRIR